MKYLLIVDKIIEKLQIFVSITLFTTIIILGTMQVVFRYLLNSSLPWSEELMRFLFIWLVFIASSITVRLDGHVSIDLLTLKLNARGQAIMFAITRLLCVAFLVIMIPAGFDLTQKAATSRAAILPISFKFVYASFFVGSILMLISYISTIPRYVKKISRGGMS